jgi:hypothetical protein
MKNDRLSSLGLVHIHPDFEVDLYKAMEVFVSYQTRREDFGQFYKCGTKCCWQIITFSNDPSGSPSCYFSPETL